MGSPHAHVRPVSWSCNERSFSHSGDLGDGYKELCDFGDCDVVYCATPWALHATVALRALNGGKIALVEVTSALTLDECWELVETSGWRERICVAVPSSRKSTSFVEAMRHRFHLT